VNILFIGDIVGKPGRTILKHALPHIVRKHRIAYTIANAENAAGGFGVTKEVCDEILDLGIECLTTGNHIWDKKEIIGFIDLIPQLVRPANYPARQPGQGSHVGRARGGSARIATLNLSGRVFIGGSIDDPFARGREEVARLKRETPIIIVDIHAEATSEKMALAYFLDGQVTAVIGTHTHVPTCDQRVLPKGTAYCSDVGMTGPYDSVIGVESATIVERFLTGMPQRFETAKGDPRLAAVIIDVDQATGLARAIDRLLLTEADVATLARE
jgi:hypothetical protein